MKSHKVRAVRIQANCSGQVGTGHPDLINHALRAVNQIQG